MTIRAVQVGTNQYKLVQFSTCCPNTQRYFTTTRETSKLVEIATKQYTSVHVVKQKRKRTYFMTIRAVQVGTTQYKLVQLSTGCPKKKTNKHVDQRAVRVSTNWYNLVQFSTWCPKEKRYFLTTRALQVSTNWYDLEQLGTCCRKNIFHDDQSCPSWCKLVQISTIQEHVVQKTKVFHDDQRAVQVSTNWYNLVQFSTCCPKKGIS